MNAPSTIGAHNNFNENGQKTKLSSGSEFLIIFETKHGNESFSKLSQDEIGNIIL